MAVFELVACGEYAAGSLEWVATGEYRAGALEVVATGSYAAGDQYATPDEFVPSGLEALAHEVLNNVGLDPTLFGEQISYIDAVGNRRVISAIVQFDSQSVRIDPDGKRRVRQGTIFISYDPTLGVAVPTRKDRFVARGEEFSIEDIGERHGGCWDMRFVRTESQVKTGRLQRFI